MALIINDAVKQLRESLEMTQDEFAKRLGIARISLARYETSRVPPFKMLWEFRRLADGAGNLQLSDIFHSAMVQVTPVMRRGNTTSTVLHIQDCQRHLLLLQPALEASPVTDWRKDFDNARESLLDIYRGVILADPDFTEERRSLAYASPFFKVLNSIKPQTKEEREKEKAENLATISRASAELGLPAIDLPDLPEDYKPPRERSLLKKRKPAKKGKA